MKRILRFLLWTLLVLLVLVVAGVGVVVSTQAGLDALLNLAERFAPGTLSYERVEGRLLGPLEVENLRYQDGELDFQLPQADFDWRPSELFSARLDITRLKVDGVEIHLPESPPEPEEEPKEPFELSDIQLPIEIQVADLSVTNTRVYLADAEKPIVIDGVWLVATTQDQALVIDKLEAKAPEGELHLEGRLTPTGAYPLSLNLDWRFQEPQLGTLSGQGSVTGELSRTLQISHDVAGAIEAQLRGEASQVMENPAWSAKLDVSIPKLEVFAPELKESELSAQVETQGTLDDFQANGGFATALPELGPVDGGFKLAGSLKAIQLSELTLKAKKSPLSLNARADVNLEAQTVAASGEWRSLAWPPIGDPQVESRQGEFQVEGTFQDYRLTLASTLSGPELGQTKTLVSAEGTDKGIKISEFSVRSPAGPRAIQITGDLDFADLAFNAAGEWKALAWPLVGPAQVESPSGQFTAQGTPKDYQLQLKAKLTSSQSGDLNALIQASGTDRAAQLSELSLKAAKGQLALNMKADVSFEDLNFNASGEWRALTWPLVGEPQVESPKGAFKANGNLEEYLFNLDTQVQGKDIPKSTWNLNGKGSATALEALDLNGKLLGGELKAKVQAAWQPSVKWQVKLTGSGLDPGVQWPEAKGKLALDLQTQGQLTEAGPEATVNLADLSGSLRDQTIKGNAQVAVKGEDLTIESLRLNAGKASLKASGKLDQRWSIDWQLKVPQLGSLLPNAKGVIAGSGTVSGPREQPKAGLNLEVSNLDYQGTQVRSLEADAQVDVSGQSRSRIVLTGNDLQLAGQRWDNLKLEGAGVPAKHGLKASLNGELGQFGLAIDGGLKDDSWQGRLASLTAQDTMAGDWRLAKPMGLRASSQAASAEQGCLTSAPSRICLQGQWDKTKGGNGRVTIDKLNPDRFADLLPDGMEINTSISGEATGLARPDGTMQGKANLDIRPGGINLIANGVPVEIVLGKSYVRAESNGKDATAQLRFDMDKLGQLEGNVQVRNLTGQPRVGGKIKGEIRSLDIVTAFAPQIQRIEGRIVADLALSGSLPIPSIQGGVRLENGAVEVPSIGADIEKIQATLASDGSGPIALSASARAGAGDIKLSGQLDPATNQLDLTIKGKEFQAANSKAIQVLISPDLTISMNTKEMRVDGTLTIPKAYLSPPDGGGGGGGAGGVSVSQDVVMVDETGKEEPKPKPANIYASVRLILGNDVVVEATGLRAQLTGNLMVNQTPRFAPRATGSMGIVSGEYVLYGQKLNIKRGEVLFSNSPLDNPGLDLKVERQIDNVVAGAQVRGTLQDPELILYSDPPMGDNDIISYLLFGSPSSENLRGAKLTIGRYLTPDLYVSYGIGLFDKVNTFNMRYRLTDSIHVESTASSDQTGADLIYIIDR